MIGSADLDLRSARTQRVQICRATSVFYTLTRVRAPQFLGFLLSDLSTPPVGVLVGVQLEKQHRVDSQGDDAAD